MSKSTELIMVLLVVICALLVYQVVFNDNGRDNLDRAYAGGAGNSEILVIPFTVGQDEQKLAVLMKDEVPYKGKKLAGEWSMAIYGWDRESLKFEASRWIGNDFILKTFGIAEKKTANTWPETLREYKERGEEPEKTKK